MLMDYAGDNARREVIDPYGRRRGVFKRAFGDIQLGCNGLLTTLLKS